MARPDISARRQAVKQLHPNKGWAKKVDKMPDYQVAAIYCRLISAPTVKEVLPSLSTKNPSPFTPTAAGTQFKLF